jgi:hypothetical protein
MEFVILQQGDFQLPPLSAFAICYVPLAAIIIGLLTFFTLTDWHARRRYLRLNPFIVAQTSQQELAERIPATGETPAGVLGAAPEGEPTVYVGPEARVAGAAPLPGAPEPRALAQERDLEVVPTEETTPEKKVPSAPEGLEGLADKLEERPQPDKPQPLDRPPTPDEQI